MGGASKPEVAVVGCGYWGKNLVRNFAGLGSLAMVCDANPAAQDVAREIAPGAAITPDFDDVLRSEIGAIVIATPAKTHYELTLQALQAGKDVLVEKPLAFTYEQGESLVQVAGEAGRVLMVGHVMEYHPAVVRLRELVTEGELGKVHYVYSNRVSMGKVRREENILWSFAPHDVAISLRLLGKMPVEVLACGGSYLQPGIPDVTVTQMLFDNGVRSHIHVSWLHPFKEQRLVVIGSRKMASFDDVAKRLVLYDQRVEIREGEPVMIRSDGEEVSYGPDEPLRLECQAFLDAVVTRQPSLTDGHSGLRVLKVLQAAQRSLSMNGHPVKLPGEVLSNERLTEQV